ncbi:MAG TPA: WD40 repeat domain-containing protein [Anaerolineales bacterium]|nr:WD40 repeat domain-containing protein [Anaerolineales bacterium]
MLKFHLLSSKIIVLVMVALLLGACNTSSPAPLPSPAPTVMLTPTPEAVAQTPTENTPSVSVTNTPASAPPIDLSNFQRLAPLYPWTIAGDIVKITGAALSPLADKVALLTVRYPEEYSLELMDSKTGDLIWKQSLDAKADYPAVAFSPDESLVAVGTGSSNITIWNVSDGSPLEVLRGASYAVRAVVFSPDGKLIAAAGSDSSVHVWQVSSGLIQFTYLLRDNVGSLAFSPDGNYLAISSNIFAVYDLAAGNGTPILYYDAIAPHPTAEILFSPDSQFLMAEGELNNRDANTWIPRILIWKLSSNRSAFRKIPIPDVIQNMIVLQDGRSVLGYDASKGQLDAIDTSSKSVAGTVDLGPLLFMDYSADYSRFLVVTKTSAALWGVSP